MEGGDGRKGAAKSRTATPTRASAAGESGKGGVDFEAARERARAEQEEREVALAIALSKKEMLDRMERDRVQAAAAAAQLAQVMEESGRNVEEAAGDGDEQIAQAVQESLREAAEDEAADLHYALQVAVNQRNRSAEAALRKAMQGAGLEVRTPSSSYATDSDDELHQALQMSLHDMRHVRVPIHANDSDDEPPLISRRGTDRSGAGPSGVRAQEVRQGDRLPPGPGVEQDIKGKRPMQAQGAEKGNGPVQAQGGEHSDRPVQVSGEAQVTHSLSDEELHTAHTGNTPAEPHTSSSASSSDSGSTRSPGKYQRRTARRRMRAEQQASLDAHDHALLAAAIARAAEERAILTIEANTVAAARQAARESPFVAHSHQPPLNTSASPSASDVDHDSDSLPELMPDDSDAEPFRDIDSDGNSLPGLKTASSDESDTPEGNPRYSVAPRPQTPRRSANEFRQQLDRELAVFEQDATDRNDSARTAGLRMALQNVRNRRWADTSSSDEDCCQHGAGAGVGPMGCRQAASRDAPQRHTFYVGMVQNITFKNMERDSYITGKDGDEAERFFHLAERFIVDEIQANLPSLDEFMQRMVLRTGEASVARDAFTQHRQAAIDAARAYHPDPNGPPPSLRDQLQELIRQLQDRTRALFNPSPQRNTEKFEAFSALQPPEYKYLFNSPTDAYNRLCALYRHVSGPNGVPEWEAVKKFNYALSELQPAISTDLVDYPPLGKRVVKYLTNKVNENHELWTLHEAHTAACKLWEQGKYYLGEELKRKVTKGIAPASAPTTDTRGLVHAAQWQGYATGSMPAHANDNANASMPRYSQPPPPPPPPTNAAAQHPPASNPAGALPARKPRSRCTNCNASNHTEDACWRLHPELAPQGWAGPKSEAGYNQWVLNRPRHWPQAPPYHLRPSTPARQRTDNQQVSRQQQQVAPQQQRGGGDANQRQGGGGPFNGGRGNNGYDSRRNQQGGRGQRGGQYQSNSVQQPPAQHNPFDPDTANLIGTMQRQILQLQQQVAAHSNPYDRDFPPPRYHSNTTMRVDHAAPPSVKQRITRVIEQLQSSMSTTPSTQQRIAAHVIEQLQSCVHSTQQSASTPSRIMHCNVVTAANAFPVVDQQVHVTTRARPLASFTQAPAKTAADAAEKASYKPPPTPSRKKVPAEPPPVVLMEGEQVATHLATKAMTLASRADELVADMRAWARFMLGNNNSPVSRMASIVASVQQQVSTGGGDPQPPAHMRNKEYTVAYLLNKSMETGISVLGDDGWELFLSMMIDCGSDIMGISRRAARKLGLHLRPCTAKMVTFGDHLCTVEEEAPMVSFRLFGNTGHEQIVQYDCYVMDNSSQYDFLVGQPMYCDWRLNMALMAYFDGVLVFPQLATQELHETIQKDGGIRLGNVYNLPCRMTRADDSVLCRSVNMVLAHVDHTLTEQDHLLHLMDHALPIWRGQGPDPGYVSLPFPPWHLSPRQVDNLREWRLSQLHAGNCHRCCYKLCRCYYAPGDMPPAARITTEPSMRRTDPHHQFVYMHADDRLDSVVGLHLHTWLRQAEQCDLTNIPHRATPPLNGPLTEYHLACEWFYLCLERCTEDYLPRAILMSMLPIPVGATRTDLSRWIRAELFNFRAYAAGCDLLNMLSYRMHNYSHIVLFHPKVSPPFYLNQAQAMAYQFFGPEARYRRDPDRGIIICVADFGAAIHALGHFADTVIHGEEWLCSNLDFDISPATYALQAAATWAEIGPVHRSYMPDFHSHPYHGISTCKPNDEPGRFAINLDAVRSFESYAAADVTPPAPPTERRDPGPLPEFRADSPSATDLVETSHLNTDCSFQASGMELDAWHGTSNMFGAFQEVALENHGNVTHLVLASQSNHVQQQPGASTLTQPQCWGEPSQQLGLGPFGLAAGALPAEVPRPVARPVTATALEADGTTGAPGAPAAPTHSGSASSGSGSSSAGGPNADTGPGGHWPDTSVDGTATSTAATTAGARPAGGRGTPSEPHDGGSGRSGAQQPGERRCAAHGNLHARSGTTQHCQVCAIETFDAQTLCHMCCKLCKENCHGRADCRQPPSHA